MFCNNCGNEINNNSKFCGKCGKTVITYDLIAKYNRRKWTVSSWIILVLSLLFVASFFIPSFTMTDEYADTVELYKELNEELYEEYKDIKSNPSAFSLYLDIFENVIDYIEFEENDENEVGFEDFFEYSGLFLAGFIIIHISLILIFSLTTLILSIIRNNKAIFVMSTILLLFITGLMFLLVGVGFLSPIRYTLNVGAYIYVCVPVALMIISAVFKNKKKLKKAPQTTNCTQNESNESNVE